MLNANKNLCFFSTNFILTKKTPHRTVISTVLKSITDIRSYQKIGKSIAKNYDTAIYLIGQKDVSDTTITKPFTAYKPYSFHRKSWRRFFFSFIYFKNLLNIKPKLIIVCTHELLFPSLVYKLFFKSKLIYDVQEDYFKNCLYSNVFPKPFSIFLAYYVRLKEKIVSQWISYFLLAEKIYSQAQQN